MIKRILAAVAVSAAVAGGATAASAAQGTSTTRMSASETIMLTPQGGSMAHGKAVLTYSMMSHKTTVVLTLTGLAKNKPHLAHFHLGRCGSNGAIKYPLTTLQSMGATMMSTSTTVVNANVMHKKLYINVHGTSNNEMKVVACGNVM
jgi:hypothetical protein